MTIFLIILVVVYILGFVATFSAIVGMALMLHIISPEPAHHTIIKGLIASVIWPLFWLYILWATK